MHQGALDPRHGGATPGHDAPARPPVARSGYDVIGDVRGSSERLTALLGRLGYEPTPDAAWHHPDRRTAVFTGGIATPHGNPTPCAPIVRAMVDAGAALCVLGPAEFDTVAAAHAPRRVLVHAHAPSAADELAANDDHEFVDWLRTVPLWLDLPDLRVVHACWSDFDIDSLRDELGSNCLADDDAVIAAATPGSSTHESIRTLLHGHRITLPDHASWFDRDGVERTTAAFRWWSTGPLTLADRAVLPPGSTDAGGDPHPGFDDTPIVDPVPVLFGGPPVVVADAPHGIAVATPDVLSLDPHARHPAQLVAYRADGEQHLTLDRLVTSP